MELKGRKTAKSRFPLIRLGLTIGDPAGIGPEIILKALAGKHPLPRACYLLFAPPAIMAAEKKSLGLEINLPVFSSWEEMTNPGIFLFPCEEGAIPAKKGEASAEAGRISFACFSRAVEEARRGHIHGLVTAPISKLSWDLAGIPWRGHTDYLEHVFPRAIMAFWSRRLRVALFTHHLPLAEALQRVSRENLINFFLELHASLERIFPEKMEYLVAGFNPHAGEGGLLGEEERKEIIPAIEEVRRIGLNFSGPYPPDVVFRQALDRRDRLVIALYHDQGLIAFKLVSFTDGVNISLGLPFARTSPDHGTAFDIAAQKIASERSMVAAIRLAYRLGLQLTT